MSEGSLSLYTVNVVTGQTAEGWGFYGPGWYRAQAATPDEARHSVMRGHLADARAALAFELRAPLHLRELHTLEQARAYLEGHVPGCHHVDLEARQCPCAKVEPATVARVAAELHRVGRATQEQIAQALTLPPLVVRAALIQTTHAIRYAHAGVWEAVAGESACSSSVQWSLALRDREGSDR